jgi:hypothetical protein
MIILARDTGKVRLLKDVGAGAICVRHRTYDPPDTMSGCWHLTWEEFEADPAAALRSRSLMIVVGLNKIITPANRTKVGPLLLRSEPGLRRVSVDRTLFISEPWRAWFHFGCVGAPYREYTYSYLAESHWKAAREGVREDPFTLEQIGQWGAGVVRCDYARWFEPLRAEVVQLDAAAHEEYAALKVRAFEEEHTESGVVGRLAAFAQERCPRRAIPSVARLFASTAPSIVRTDLAVDAYLAEQIERLVSLTDGIASLFHRPEVRRAG